MGILIKIVLFIIVGAWIFRGVARMLLKPFMEGAQRRGPQQQTRQQSRPKDGNVDVNFAPKKGSQKKSTENFNGGDYVDYEEVD